MGSRPLMALLGLLAIWSGCAPLPPIAQPATVTDNLGPAGPLGAPPTVGPDLVLFGDKPVRRLLAVDPTGFRAALTDGRQVMIWDGGRGQIERLLPWSGQVVRSAAFEPGGRLLAVYEHQSELRPGLARVRLIDLEQGRDLSHVDLPCGCLIEYAFSHDGQRLFTVVSSDAYDGTWLLSWSIEGEVVGGLKLSEEVFAAGDLARFYTEPGGAERLLLFRSGGRGHEGITLVDVDALTILHQGAIHANDLGVPCGPGALPCSQAVAVDPERGHLLVATGLQGGPTRLTAWALPDAQPRAPKPPRAPAAEWIAAAPMPRWNTRPRARATRQEPSKPSPTALLLREERHQGVVPFAWLPGRAGWSLVGHVGASDHEGWRLMRLTPEGLVLSAVQPELPVTPLARFAEGWVSVHQTELFREAFQLPQPSGEVVRELEEARWYANGSRAATHPESGERLYASLHGAWVWPREGSPSFLPGVNVANAVALMPGGRRPGPEGANEPRVVRSTGAAVEQSVYTVGDWWGGGSLSRPVTRWEPLGGFVREVALVGEDRLLTLTRVGERRVELEVVDAPDGSRPRSLASTRLGLVDTRYAWRLVTARDRSKAAVVALADDPKTGGRLLEVHVVTLPELEPMWQRRVEFGPEDVWLETHRDCGDLVLYTRGSVLRVSAWEPEATPNEATWFPESWGWIKGVVPVGGGVVAVRAVRQELPSSEWWVWLDLSDARHRVLGHRAFHDAVVWASWPRGEEVDVLEASGRVTRLRVTSERRVEVTQRALLHSSKPVFIEVDKLGRVGLPQEVRSQRVVRRWLDERAVTPIVVGEVGRVAP